MACVDYALQGICCLPSCRDYVSSRPVPQLSGKITKIETLSGTHYVCEDCLERKKQEYQSGKIDFLRVRE